MDLDFLEENYPRDLTPDNAMDVDGMVCPSEDFRPSVDKLNFSQKTDPILNDFDIEKANSSTLTLFESSIDASDDMFGTNFRALVPMSYDQVQAILDEAASAQNMCSASDAQHNSMNNNLIQQTHADGHESTEATSKSLQDSIDQLFNSVEVDAIVAALQRYPNQSLEIDPQPVQKHRFRFRSEGIRYLEKSRENPMTIKVLLMLDGYLTQSYQSFWLKLTLVTTENNPHGKVFLHQHEITYHGENAIQNGSQSFLIPLTDEDIRRRRKILRHLSVIRSLKEDYKFKLTPFHPRIVDNQQVCYTLDNEDRLTIKQKAKAFDQDYQTNTYRIVCQLLIKQKNEWYTTDLCCQTHTVHHS